MKTIKAIAALGAALACVALPACSNSDGTNGSTPLPEGTISTPVPSGGAAGKMGTTETTISKAACLEMSGIWTMSGADETGSRIAVTTTADKQTVTSASIALVDGKSVQFTEGTGGTASIVWHGDSFTVTGKGTMSDLSLETPTATPDTDFVIKATCTA